MPTGSTYTVNYTLTQYAVSYYNTQFDNLAAFIAPSVQCPGLVGTYKSYDKGYAFSVTDTARGLYESAKIIDLHGEDTAYKLTGHALKIGIDDDELRGAGNEAAYRSQLQHIKTARLVRTMMLSHNKQVFDAINAKVPVLKNLTGEGVDLLDIGKWSDDSINARQQLKLLVKRFYLVNGVYPNRMLASSAAWDTLGANSSIRDAIRYNSTDELTAKQLANLMGYDEMGQQIDIRHTAIPYNTQLPGVEGVNKDMLNNQIYLYYAEDSPSMDDISAAKTLSLAGEEEITSVETKRDDDHYTDWMRVTSHTLVVVPAPSSMMRITVS